MLYNIIYRISLQNTTAELFGFKEFGIGNNCASGVKLKIFDFDPSEILNKLD